MPIIRTANDGVVARFGAGDLLTVHTSPTLDGEPDTLAILDFGTPHDIGAYHDIGSGRQLTSKDRIAVQLKFANRESLRVVIEQLEALDEYMSGKRQWVPTPTPHGGANE